MQSQAPIDPETYRLPFGGIDSVQAKVDKIYANQGLHTAALAFVNTHPLAVEYLQQAPVLLFTHGALPDYKRMNTWFQMRVVGPCSRGVTLREMMAEFRVPYPMRKIKGYALSPSIGPVLLQLAKLDPRVLGNIIPEKPGAQRKWMSNLSRWLDLYRMNMKAHTVPLRFEWIAANAGKATKENFRTVADFALRGDTFNEAWGWKRALEEAEAWHDRLTAEALFRQLPFPPDTQIDAGKHPDLDQMSGYDFHALRTPQQIADEGAAMRHCVGSYIQLVLNSRCHIVSMKHGCKRVATIELSPDYRVRQIKGRFNAEPTREEREAADWYARDIRTALKSPAKP